MEATILTNMKIDFNKHICLACLKGTNKLELKSGVSLTIGKCQNCSESLVGAKAIKFKKGDK